MGRIALSDGPFIEPIDGVVLGSLFELDVAAPKSFPILGMVPYVGDDFWTSIGLFWSFSPVRVTFSSLVVLRLITSLQCATAVFRQTYRWPNH